MNKVLGLDLGTNSIGWAIVEEKPLGYTLREHGVDIFQEGVKIEKGIESSKAAERTDHRSARRRLMRRKLRKIETLKVLSQASLCPRLAPERLKAWKQDGAYPLDEAFILWQRTEGDKNPYHDRNEALTCKLNLDSERDRHILGRALYHIAQRRGFQSNRLEKNKESEGAVKQGIDELSRQMREAGCRFLGEYFYKCYQTGEKIRTRYTSRKEHYKAEFDEICRVQQLDEDLAGKLERAIFFQRPLKSQKGLVGKCTFEKSKSRCPASHPRFEEFRMRCFINNIRIQTPRDEELRPLTAAEREQIVPLFLRKSKRQFDFDDIAKKLAGKDNYAYYKDDTGKPYLFNYRMNTSVAGSPVTAHLAAIFGEDWEGAIVERYTAGAGKSSRQIVNDVWHALFFFDDDDKLRTFAQDKLRCTEEQAEEFCKIPVPQDYAALSLGAIEKILPFLRQGMLYSHAVFLANMAKVLPVDVWNNPDDRASIIGAVGAIIADDPRQNEATKAFRIGGFIEDNFDVPAAEVQRRLYHPSMIDNYPEAKPDEHGRVRLGSPRTSSVRNPMAMRALFRLRKLINALLDEGKIDRGTKIRIEFARGLNDANRRKAIEAWQREREAERYKYREEIKKLFREECGGNIDPSEVDILKFQLWREQNEMCPYTGRSISICQFLGVEPEFDIEHTVPRSVGGDDSQMNKTLCESKFNREIKKTKLPSELTSHNEVLARIAHWETKCEGLRERIESQIKRAKAATTKESKDRAIQERHRLKIELDYWSGKLRRFTMEEVPEGFSNRQGIDIGIISKYARLYLQSVFPRIYVTKGLTTAEFRRMWGLQEQYAKKERVNHVHHLVDAVTIACIGANEYSRMAAYFHAAEQYRWRGDREKPQFPKPWPTFTEDVLALEQALIVSHHTPDNMSRQTKKKLRVRGQVQYGKNGETLYVSGDSARGSLHKDTFYGAILREDEHGDMKMRHVVRKPLGDLKPEDVKNIVDDVVRAKVEQAIAVKGFKQAMVETVWMNEEKGVEIKKVRCFAPMVTSPILLKEHRDTSRHEHKRHLRVVNDGNHLMAVYEGMDAKGKTKRDFEIINNLEAAKYFKASNDREAFSDIVPLSKNEYPLKWTFKTGTMVLFYENSPEEIYEADSNDLRKRLYKVIGFEKDGRATFRFHQEARKDEELQKVSEVDFVSPQSKLRLSKNNFNMLVEGYDFELSVTGEVKFKRR